MKVKEFINKTKSTRVDGIERKDLSFTIKILKENQIEEKRFSSVKSIEEEIEILEAEIVTFLDFSIMKFVSDGFEKRTLDIDVLVK